MRYVLKYIHLKVLLLSSGLLSLILYVNAQVAEINWTLDYQLYLKMANDSGYAYDIRNAFHVNKSEENFNSGFVFYPVNPGKEFASSIPPASINNESYKTLWSALHAKIGGGWIHFINCIAYALETQKLDLSNPLMVRPTSNWRPNPMTDSYNQTRDWKFYVPVEQKLAQKEYKRRLAANELGNLKSLPQSYIDLFLSTNQKQYNKLKDTQKYNQLAKIDLVKVIIGANYLGEAQISYISNSVLEAILSYAGNMLPSVIIFDEFDAAALMSLNADGYKIDKLAFKASAAISEDEAVKRSDQIKQVIDKINEYNNNSFKKRLGNYYKE